MRGLLVITSKMFGRSLHTCFSLRLYLTLEILMKVQTSNVHNYTPLYYI